MSALQAVLNGFAACTAYVVGGWVLRSARLWWVNRQQQRAMERFLAEHDTGSRATYRRRER